jgi:hypothetical protein
MDNIKPWQIILFLVAIAVLGFSVWKFTSSGSVPKTNGYLTVDIMTGQLYDIRKGKARGVPLPAKHPDTGDRTLYPVNQVDELVYEIPSGFETFLTEQVREGSKLDSGKMTITVLPDDPIKFVLLK